MTTAITDLDDFKALDAFFRIIEKGLEGFADGGHFFDLLAEEVIFDYMITVPGYPRRVEGRKAVAELYRPYGTMIVLDRCHDLAVHHDIKTGVVVLEYASEGRVVPTGAPYANRYISVLTITDRTLPRPRGGLRRARMAVTLSDGATQRPPASLFASLMPADVPDQMSDAPAAGGADDVVRATRPLAVAAVWRRDRLAG
jgi:ketosteroid isomerase-like protein